MGVGSLVFRSVAMCEPELPSVSSTAFAPSGPGFLHIHRVHTAVSGKWLSHRFAEETLVFIEILFCDGSQI